jgi:hypothetical protein
MNTHVRDNLNSLGPVIKKSKGLDESVTSSTTLQDDNDFTFAIAASEVWVLQLSLWIVGIVGGDFKYQLSVPSGATGGQGWQGLHASATTADAADLFTSAATDDFSIRVIGCVSASPYSFARVYYNVFNSTNAGNVTLQWAQNASSGTSTTLKKGSWLYAVRMSP